jgi:hypothetical protein
MCTQLQRLSGKIYEPAQYHANGIDKLDIDNATFALMWATMAPGLIVH